MKRTLFVMAIVVGLATAASAATLSVVSNKATYAVGETITLSVSGDGQGSTAYSAIGRLLYSAALTDTVSVTENLIGTNWSSSGSPAQGDGFAEAFNQVAFPSAQPSNNLPAGNPFAIVTLLATAPGVVDVTWSGALSFFEIQGTNPGTSFTIVPEPTTAALLGLGLLGLGIGGRRRS